MNSSTFVILSTLCFLPLIFASGNVRFLDNILGNSITFHTSVGDSTLSFQQVTDYTAVSSSTVQIYAVTNVGGSETDANYLGETATIPVGDYTTVVATYVGESFVLVVFNETSSTPISSSNAVANEAWVRLIDLASTLNSVNLEIDSQTTLFSSVGFLEATPFELVNTQSTTSFRVTATGTSNHYPVTMSSNLQAGSVYTIFLFNSMSGPQGNVVFDRTAGSAPSSSTSGSTPSSSGSTPSSSGSVSTSSPVTPSSGSNNGNPEVVGHHNASPKTQAIGAGVLFAILLLISF